MKTKIKNTLSLKIVEVEAFYFDEVPFVYSFLYVPCFRGCVYEDVAAWNVWDFPANVFL